MKQKKRPKRPVFKINHKPLEGETKAYACSYAKSFKSIGSE
jgi:hypothetical protein